MFSEQPEHVVAARLDRRAQRPIRRMQPARIGQDVPDFRQPGPLARVGRLVDQQVEQGHARAAADVHQVGEDVTDLEHHALGHGPDVHRLRRHEQPVQGGAEVGGESLDPLLVVLRAHAEVVAGPVGEAGRQGDVQLPGLLRHCLTTPGVQLIDCPVDYAENDRILNKEIRELSAAA